MRPLVSVNIATYNHKLYISQCIDGVLMQKTNFPFEIIVHDDASTDFTQIILKEYESRHPNLFNNIYQTENQHSKKDVSIWADFMFPKAKGKYIALCDGDDYWTDPYKLQIQVDFLEDNNDYNICYHDVQVFTNDGLFSSDFIQKTNKCSTNVYDLAVWGNYIHTSSVVFRNNFFSIKPEFRKYICDYFLYMNLIKEGKIKKIQEIMSVYRYDNGIWSGSSYYEKQKFILDNIFSILKTTEDDTINKIMNLRLDSIAFYSLPNYITKIEDSTNRSFDFELNEKIPISILLNVINKKIILKLKKIILKFSKFS
jgi:glycosyltransferase involved in cell wall biosynthesis